MRQETINTFSEGLNYDLNPLTTPNNVLTDCINGTFITFNGDELALQNDAGNTKIQIPGTDPAEYVTLSTGFLPLGIKEYGGVLYIISGKLFPSEDLNSIGPTNIVIKEVSNDPGKYYINKGQFNISTGYLKYEVVYTDNLERTYYLSLIGEAESKNYNPLPINSNQYWKVIGNINDYNNYFGEVEIGSYPSPEASASKDYDGELVWYYSSTNTLPSLYKYIVINNEEFKTGRYIIFNSAETPTTSNITYYSNGVYYRRFYKIRLYHQLNNGYLDLSNNLWARFDAYKDINTTNTSDFWFYKSWTGTEPDDFIYYCPSQYKGKLVLSLEIEDLKTFRLEGLPTFSKVIAVPDNTYTFTLKTYAENWYNDSNNGTVLIPSVKVEIWKDGVKQNLTSELDGTFTLGGSADSATISLSANIGTFTLKEIPESYENNLLTYRITPILQVVGESTYGEAELPKEFIDKYTISGSRKITTNYDDIVFEPVNNTGCDSVYIGYLNTNEYILKNRSGDYLDLDLLPQATPHIFLKQGATAKTEGATLINNYTINATTKKAEIVGTPQMSDPFITDMFEQEVVSVYSESCAGTPAEYVGITLNFSMPLSTATTITVTQNSTPVVYTGYTTDSVIIDVIKGTNTQIIIERGGFEGVDIYRPVGFTTNEIFNIGFIAQVWLNADASTYQLRWLSEYGTLPVLNNSLTYRIKTTYDDLIDILIPSGDGFSYEGGLYTNAAEGTFIDAEIISYDSTVLDNVYYNVGTGYVKQEGIIFNSRIQN